MKVIQISQINKEYVGRKVVIRGFIHDIRILSKMIFLEIRDVTGKIQVVVSKDNESYSEVKHLSKETILWIKGEVTRSSAKKYEHEVILKKYKVISTPVSSIPIEVNTHKQVNIGKRFKYRYLDLRRPEVQIVFKT